MSGPTIRERIEALRPWPEGEPLIRALLAYEKTVTRSASPTPNLDAMREAERAARAAAPPVEAGETRAQYGPDYTASRGPQIRRDGYHYGHCWRRWVEIEPDKVAPCICAQWPPLETPGGGPVVARGTYYEDPVPVAGLREALNELREFVDKETRRDTGLTYSVGGAILSRIDRLAALLDEPVPPKSYWMEFLEWESQAAAQGSGMTAEQKTGAAIFRSWLVNHAPDDGRPEKVAEPVPLDWRETYLRTLMNEIRGVIADSEDEPEAVKRIAARLTDPKGATE